MDNPTIRHDPNDMAANPIAHDRNEATLRALDVAFVIFFFVEMVIKMVALGLWDQKPSVPQSPGQNRKHSVLIDDIVADQCKGTEHNRGYFSDVWNRLDFVIVLESL
jgi:hypothetical protein